MNAFKSEGALTTLAEREPEDDAVTVSTKTDDDPVTLAMRTALQNVANESDDEEQILYPKHLLTPRYAITWGTWPTCTDCVTTEEEMTIGLHCLQHRLQLPSRRTGGSPHLPLQWT